MELFAILLNVMTKDGIFDIGREPEFTIAICAAYVH